MSVKRLTPRELFGDPFQIYSELVNVAKNVAGSKKRIRWVFGYSEDVGVQHEVVLIHSVLSGKKTILENGREIICSSSIVAQDFSYGWTSETCRRLYRVEIKVALAETLYDMSIDGMRYSHFPSLTVMNRRKSEISAASSAATSGAIAGSSATRAAAVGHSSNSNSYHGGSSGHGNFNNNNNNNNNSSGYNFDDQRSSRGSRSDTSKESRLSGHGGGVGVGGNAVGGGGSGGAHGRKPSFSAFPTAKSPPQHQQQQQQHDSSAQPREPFQILLSGGDPSFLDPFSQSLPNDPSSSTPSMQPAAATSVAGVFDPFVEPNPRSSGGGSGGFGSGAGFEAFAEVNDHGDVSTISVTPPDPFSASSAFVSGATARGGATNASTAPAVNDPFFSNGALASDPFEEPVVSRPSSGIPPPPSVGTGHHSRSHQIPASHSQPGFIAFGPSAAAATTESVTNPPKHNRRPSAAEISVDLMGLSFGTAPSTPPATAPTKQGSASATAGGDNGSETDIPRDNANVRTEAVAALKEEEQSSGDPWNVAKKLVDLDLTGREKDTARAQERRQRSSIHNGPSLNEMIAHPGGVPPRRQSFGSFAGSNPPSRHSSYADLTALIALPDANDPFGAPAMLKPDAAPTPTPPPSSNVIGRKGSFSSPPSPAERSSTGLVVAQPGGSFYGARLPVTAAGANPPVMMNSSYPYAYQQQPQQQPPHSQVTIAGFPSTFPTQTPPSSAMNPFPPPHAGAVGIVGGMVGYNAVTSSSSSSATIAAGPVMLPSRRSFTGAGQMGFAAGQNNPAQDSSFGDLKWNK